MYKVPTLLYNELLGYLYDLKRDAENILNALEKVSYEKEDIHVKGEE